MTIFLINKMNQYNLGVFVETGIKDLEGNKQ